MGHCQLNSGILEVYRSCKLFIENIWQDESCPMPHPLPSFKKNFCFIVLMMFACASSDMSFNNVTGSIPAELGQLQNLFSL